MITDTIRVLSLPSRHPYMAKFHNRGKIVFANAETDYFNDIGGNASASYIEQHHPSSSYDVVHIHFSFDRLTPTQLGNLLDYFEEAGKPVVWTCHSRTSQRLRNLWGGQHQSMLYKRAARIVTLTNGCKKWLENSFEYKREDIIVIPHGFIVDPSDIAKYQTLAKKDQFIYLVGEFRQNKEVIQTILNFLQCSELLDATLLLIFKPINLYSNGFNTTIDENMKFFWELTHDNPRINIISLPELPNDLIYKHFFESRWCLLPYLWGTHSGQLELCRDSGCSPIISDVGFYAEQWSEISTFAYSDNTNVFARNLTTAMMKARYSPSVIINPLLRNEEFETILKMTTEIYQSCLR